MHVARGPFWNCLYCLGECCTSATAQMLDGISTCTREHLGLNTNKIVLGNGMTWCTMRLGVCTSMVWCSLALLQHMDIRGEV